MNINRRNILLSGAAALAWNFAMSGLPAFADTMPSPEAAHEIAVEAYIYFYPLVTMDLTRRVTTNLPAGEKPGYGPMNAFSNIRAYPDANFRAVVRPNFDTLYSSGWLDLNKEPMIVSLPDTHDRYYLMPMLDMWTNAFAVPGKRTSGTQAGDFAVVPPGWSGDLPTGVERIDAPTPYVWIVGRTQTNGPSDYAAVNKLQDSYLITPLSLWGKPPVAATATIDPGVDMKTDPKSQVDTMKAADYFKYAAELLKVNAPQVTDWSTIARLKRIGIEPGKSFDMAALDPALQAAFETAPAEALKAMADKTPTLARIVNGWQMNTDTMGVYGDYYLKRAIVAQFGLGANQPEDAVYPLLVADADGKPTTGNNNYVIHFTKDDIPPVNAFWSLTMYDSDGFQVANPINRFAIGDRDALKKGDDGSIDIYFQHDDPGGDKTANWLPSPASGPISIAMRLYAPKAEALDGRWNPPAVQRR